MVKIFSGIWKSMYMDIIIIIMVMPLNRFPALCLFIDTNLKSLEWRIGQVIHEERSCLITEILYCKSSSLAFPKKELLPFVKAIVHFTKRNNPHILGLAGHWLWTDLNSRDTKCCYSPPVRVNIVNVRWAVIVLIHLSGSIVCQNPCWSYCTSNGYRDGVV